MADYDLKPNSHKYKEEQAQVAEKKKVDKVVTGKVRRKKKSELSKITEVFVAEDASNVGSYLLFDVLVPAVKDAVVDIVQNGISMLMYGGAGKGRRSSSRSEYVSYDKKYRDQDRFSRREPSTRTSGRYNFDDIILDTRQEAENVLSSMDDIIETYGIVSVADFNDLVGISGYYTDNKYGWKNLRNAEVIRVRDGYMLKLPKALPID